MQQQKNLSKPCHTAIPILRNSNNCFRFFTVYGPWGRPDMALFSFTNNILNPNRLRFSIRAKCLEILRMLEIRRGCEVSRRNTYQRKVKKETA